MRNQFIILIVVALIFVFVFPIETAQDNAVDKLRKEIKSQYQEILNRQDTIMKTQNDILEKVEKVRKTVLATK